MRNRKFRWPKRRSQLFASKLDRSGARKHAFIFAVIVSFAGLGATAPGNDASASGGPYIERVEGDLTVRIHHQPIFGQILNLTLINNADDSESGDATITLTISGCNFDPFLLTIPPRQTESLSTAPPSAGKCQLDLQPTLESSFLVEVEVLKADQTITFTSTAPLSVLPGETYLPSAVSQRTHDNFHTGLPITFSVSPENVCDIDVDGVVTFRGAGSCVVTAQQVGTDNYLPVVVTKTIAVERFTPVVVISPPGVKTPYTDDFLLTVQLLEEPGAPAGLVFPDPEISFELTEGSGAHCQVNPVNGLVSTNGKSPGSCTIRVTSAQTAHYNEVSELVGFEMRTPIDLIDLTGQFDANEFGEEKYLQVRVNQAGVEARRDCGAGDKNQGTFTFGEVVNSDDVVPISFYRAGDCSVEFAVPGTTFFSTFIFTVSKASQSLAFGEAAPAEDNALVGMTYTPTVSSTRDHDKEPTGLPVSIEVSTESAGVCVASIDGIVTFLSTGDCVVTASQNGDDNYQAASPLARTIVVGKAVNDEAGPHPGDDQSTSQESQAPPTLNSPAAPLLAGNLEVPEGSDATDGRAGAQTTRVPLHTDPQPSLETEGDDSKDLESAVGDYIPGSPAGPEGSTGSVDKSSLSPSANASVNGWEGAAILGFGIVAVALLLGLGLMSLGVSGVSSGAGGPSRFVPPAAP